MVLRNNLDLLRAGKLPAALPTKEDKDFYLFDSKLYHFDDETLFPLLRWKNMCKNAEYYDRSFSSL